MYYLHLIDTVVRGHVIVIDESAGEVDAQLFINDGPVVSYSGGPTMKVKNGWMLGPVETETEARTLAFAIASHYNFDVELDGELLHLPQKSRNDAAAILGSARSERKAAASRENGRKGGRPRGQE